MDLILRGTQCLLLHIHLILLARILLVRLLRLNLLRLDIIILLLAAAQHLPSDAIHLQKAHHIVVMRHIEHLSELRPPIGDHRLELILLLLYRLALRLELLLLVALPLDIRELLVERDELVLQRAPLDLAVCNIGREARRRHILLRHLDLSLEVPRLLAQS